MLDLLAVILAAAVPQTANTPETLPAAQPTAQMQLPVQTLPRANSLQQAFDAASADASAGKCAEAVAAFEALERNPKVKPGSLSAAAMSVRKGQCLVRLGRYAEGEMAIAAGLPALEKADGNFDADVAEGQIALGDAAMSRWDYTGASLAYRKALALQKGDQRIIALAKLAKATSFDGGTAPLAHASEGINLLSAATKPDKDALAAFHTLQARTLLNQGNAQEAYKELKQALALSGGLTSRTTLSEVALRGDLAMAAMQIGRKDDARLYLAYTGAGRIEKSPFATAVSMDPPLCGEETGLRPDDVAVVDFSIGDNGSVNAAQTVYSRGGPAVAAAFSKAVSEWYWQPGDVAAIPLFYRLATRVEVRCSNVMGGGPGVFSPLDNRFSQWASSLLPALAHSSNNPADLAPILRSYAEDRGKNGDFAAQFAALSWLVLGEPVSPQIRIATVDEALALAVKAKVPAEAIAWLRIARLRATMATHKTNRADRSAVLALAADPAIAGDALAVDTLRLVAGSIRSRANPEENAASFELLMSAAQDSRLPERHPLRQLAWLRLADIAAAAADRPKAQAYFTNTGLTEQQCAALSVAPTMRSNGASSADYPMEALMMGFEGWVRLEFDINADGRTANARPIVSYPPLIFTDAAKGMVRDIRYDTSYRPGDGVACSANRDTIRFVIPSNH
jgi:tetratricopeptide (TPR) repeat protein